MLDKAHAALRTAVEGVSADACERPTPCERWNVTQVLQHAVGDQLATPD
ncbi:maleylpyruvate isomerase N-terminal domain-containing protein [Micromonospora sp. DT15]